MKRLPLANLSHEKLRELDIAHLLRPTSPLVARLRGGFLESPAGRRSRMKNAAKGAVLQAMTVKISSLTRQ